MYMVRFFKLPTTIKRLTHKDSKIEIVLTREKENVIIKSVLNVCSLVAVFSYLLFSILE